MSKTILDKSLFGKLKPVKQIDKYKELHVNKGKTDTVTRTRALEVLAQVSSPPTLSDTSQNALETSQKAPSLSEKEVPSLSLTSHVLWEFLVTNIILYHNTIFLHFILKKKIFFKSKPNLLM